MKEKSDKRERRRGVSLLLSILLVFCVFGTVVYAVARKTSREMSAAAIQNLSESLDLIQCTIEAILNNEAEFQSLIAREAARTEDPEAFIRSYESNRTVVKLSLILAGKAEGVSNNGEPFTGEGLDFSAGGDCGRNAGVPVLSELHGHMVLYHEMPRGAGWAGDRDTVY